MWIRAHNADFDFAGGQQRVRQPHAHDSEVFAEVETSRNTSRTMWAFCVKGENSVKLFGDDLETIEKTANKTSERDGEHNRHRGFRRVFVLGTVNGPY